MVDRKHRDFTEGIQEDGSLGDINSLAKTFEDFQNGELEEKKGFSAIATIEDIAKQDYILTPGRYVGIEEQEDDGEPFEEKMTRLTSELSGMFERSHELEEEIRKKLGAIGYMSLNDEIVYYLIFDTNVLFQTYEKKADFTSFNFNATYDNVIDMINRLDIYNRVILAIPSVVWNEMEKQIIDKHDELLLKYKNTITKKEFSGVFYT